ncbi:MAG TPA: hypothetical protein VEW04_11435 [Allosphingosinicella sp.]|nr:hypothetical protein [Allosphingosinicella sp.]
MSLSPHEADFAEPLPAGVARRDMPDGRTRILVLRDFLPNDIKDQNPINRHRVIDLATGLPVLSLWDLDCASGDEWQDGALDLVVRPTGLNLRIDLARGEFRAGDGIWHPLAELQLFVELAIGQGFNIRAAWQASEPERERAYYRRRRRDRTVALLGGLILALAAIWLVWMLIYHPEDLRHLHLWRFPGRR